MDCYFPMMTEDQDSKPKQTSVSKTSTIHSEPIVSESVNILPEKRMNHTILQKSNNKTHYATPIHSPERIPVTVTPHFQEKQSSDGVSPGAIPISQQEEVLRTLSSPLRAPLRGSQKLKPVLQQEMTPPENVASLPPLTPATGSTNPSHTSSINLDIPQTTMNTQNSIPCKLFDDENAHIHLRSKTESSSISSEAISSSLLSKRRNVLVAIYCGNESKTQDSLEEILNELVVVSEKRRRHIKYDFNMSLDADGYTALHWAAFCGRVSLLKGFIARGANSCTMTRRGETPLHRAVLGIGSFNQFIFAELVQVLASNVFIPDERGRTVLHYIALISKIPSREKVASYYMSVIADVIRMQQRFTGHSFSAFLDAQNSVGDTALHIACRHQHYRSVEILTRLGASASILNHHGETCHSIAGDDVRLLRILNRRKSDIVANADDYIIEDYDDPPMTPIIDNDPLSDMEEEDTDAEAEFTSSLAQTMSQLERFYGSRNTRKILYKLSSPLKKTSPTSLDTVQGSFLPSPPESEERKNLSASIDHAADMLRPCDPDLFEIKDLSKSLGRLFRKSESLELFLKEKMESLDNPSSISTLPEKRPLSEVAEDESILPPPEPMIRGGGDSMQGSRMATTRASKRRRQEELVTPPAAPKWTLPNLESYLAHRLDQLKSAMEECEQYRDALKEELAYMRKERLVKDYQFHHSLGKLCQVPTRSIAPAIRRLAR